MMGVGYLLCVRSFANEPFPGRGWVGDIFQILLQIIAERGINFLSKLFWLVKHFYTLDFLRKPSRLSPGKRSVLK